MRCTHRPVLALVFLATFMLAAPLFASADQDRQPIAYVAELDGIIHPISAEYLTGVIDLADTAGADLVVIILRTPGGLLDSTRTIVSRMITSRAPVVVFVGPAGARAASAGFVLTMAADVAAMAPGTHIGAAHPVSGGGQQMDETTAKKAASDAAAYVRSLVEARHRNVMLADQAVIESRAFTDTEASARSASVDRSGRAGYRRSAAPSRWPRDHAIRRPLGHHPDAGYRAAADRDVASPAISRHHRPSADRIPAADARHDRTDRRVVEPRRHPSRRRWRPEPPAGVFCVSDSAGEHVGAVADCVWPGVAHPRAQGAELWRARRGRRGEPADWLADAHARHPWREPRSGPDCPGSADGRRDRAVPWPAGARRSPAAGRRPVRTRSSGSRRVRARRYRPQQDWSTSAAKSGAPRAKSRSMRAESFASALSTG